MNSNYDVSNPNSYWFHHENNINKLYESTKYSDNTVSSIAEIKAYLLTIQTIIVIL